VSNKLYIKLRILFLVTTLAVSSFANLSAAPYEIVHTGVLKTYSATGEVVPGSSDAYAFRG